MSVRATSPRSGPTSVYTKMHIGLDHALMLLLKGEDAPPPEWKLGSSGRQKPFEAWRAIREIAADRRQALIEKEARRHAKRKLKKKEEQEEEEEKPEPKLVFVVKPTKAKEEVKKEKEKKKKAEGKGPVVKTLDLSGANLSPVITHNKAPSSRTNHDRLVTVDAMKPLVKDPESLIVDTLTRLRGLPLLENLESGSNKYKAIVKWLETDDGSNHALSPSLSSMINKLQKNGNVAASLDNGKSSPKRALSLDNETLNDRLKRERKLNRKNGVKKNGVKTERGRRKSTGGSAVKRRIQDMDGFVVGSDEEEYEDSAWVQDSEEEYESEEASGSDDGIDFEIAVEGVEDTRPEEPPAKPRTSTLPDSGKASPKSPSNGSTQQPLSATEQLAVVTAKLRESEKTDASQSEPTYLSYSKSDTNIAIKQEPNVPVLKIKLIPADAGSSESNAIVLDDSDDEDDEDAPVDVVLHPRVLPPPASPKSPSKPSPRKQAPGPRSPKPSPRQKATPPQPKTPPADKTATKAAGKAKAVPATKKRKVEESEEEESQEEAEFVAPGEEDSSTDDEEDMFDLNEDDVYVVESILEAKRGRTLVTNFGRPTKEADLFLVKWEGYDELTWEPDANIPKRIIQFFNEREQFKKNCGYQIDKFLQRKVAKNSTTGRDEILYLIQWKGMPQAYWEVKATLPPKIYLWLEKTSRATLGKSGLAGPSPRKKTKA